jgi:hypothetical protein
MSRVGKSLKYLTYPLVCCQPFDFFLSKEKAEMAHGYPGARLVFLLSTARLSRSRRAKQKGVVPFRNYPFLICLCLQASRQLRLLLSLYMALRATGWTLLQLLMAAFAVLMESIFYRKSLSFRLGLMTIDT